MNIFSKQFVFVRVAIDQRYYVRKEPVVRRCFGKNVSLKVCRKTLVLASVFIKATGRRPTTILKRDFSTDVFL